MELRHRNLTKSSQKQGMWGKIKLCPICTFWVQTAPTSVKYWNSYCPDHLLPALSPTLLKYRDDPEEMTPHPSSGFTISPPITSCQSDSQAFGFSKSDMIVEGRAASGWHSVPWYPWSHLRERRAEWTSDGLLCECHSHLTCNISYISLLLGISICTRLFFTVQSLNMVVATFSFAQGGKRDRIHS